MVRFQFDRQQAARGAEADVETFADALIEAVLTNRRATANAKVGEAIL